MTPSGQRISDLPIEEAKFWTAKLMGTAAPAANDEPSSSSLRKAPFGYIRSIPQSVRVEGLPVSPLEEELVNLGGASD